MKKIKFLKKSELVIVVSILIVCIVVFIFTTTNTIGNFALVTYNGKEHARVKLSNNAIIKIDADLAVTLEVNEGKIRFINSLCPDKLCENFGKIYNEKQYAICVPAGVAVQIVAG